MGKAQIYVRPILHFQYVVPVRVKPLHSTSGRVKTEQEKSSAATSVDRDLTFTMADPINPPLPRTRTEPPSCPGVGATRSDQREKRDDVSI